MSTFISILRGINVGGHNPVKMDTLRQLYKELGYSDIQSYIQSGNIIFSSDSFDALFLERTIRKKILETYGWDIPVLVITAEELTNALINNPFVTDGSKDSAFIHLTFLSDQPDKELVQKIKSEIYMPDEFYISGKTIYLYCPTGYGNSKLNNTFFENKLRLTATTRNLKTSLELLRLAENIINR